MKSAVSRYWSTNGVSPRIGVNVEMMHRPSSPF